MHTSIIMDLSQFYHILDTLFMYFLCNNQYVLIKLHYSATLLKLFCALKLFKKCQGQHNNIMLITRYHIINLYYITPTTGLLS